MTILKLREKRNKAWEAAKAFVETKRDKEGLLSAEDAATYAEMEAMLHTIRNNFRNYLQRIRVIQPEQKKDGLAWIMEKEYNV